jgi:hypothetical protein
MTWTLVDAGYNMTDIVKAFMINTGFHLHYPDDTTEEDEFVEKIETHMEKVLHYEIPIVPAQIPIKEEQDGEKEENTWVRCNFHHARYQFQYQITSFADITEKELDIAEPKTTNKKNIVTLYDDECL